MERQPLTERSQELVLGFQVEQTPTEDRHLKVNLTPDRQGVANHIMDLVEVEEKTGQEKEKTV